MSTIKRSKRKTPFVQMDKHALQNKKLSWKAKGLLAYLLSLPDDWQIYVNELKEHATDGRDATTNALNELIKSQYISREMTRNDKGYFSGYDYVVFDSPFTAKPETDKPFTDNPNSDKPITEKPTLLILDNNNKQNTNKENKPDKQDLSTTIPLFSEFKEILAYLTKKSGNKFRLPKTAAKIKASNKYVKITARLKDYSIEDLKAVIDVKCKEWLSDPHFKQYLVPKTLFAPTKFEDYIDQVMNQNNTKVNGVEAIIDTYTLPPALETAYNKSKAQFDSKSVAKRISYFTKQQYQSWMKGGTNFEKYRDRGVLTKEDIYRKISGTISMLNTDSFYNAKTGKLIDYINRSFETKIKHIG